jgi:hypothetical protein
MQIITIDDSDFPRLLDAFFGAQEVGRYWRNGRVQLVRVSQQFVFVVSEDNPEKIAIKPVRSLYDAEVLGKQLLTREEQRGNRIELKN